MNKELIEILNCIRIWSFKSQDGCSSDYFLDSNEFNCHEVSCTCCPLFQIKNIRIYSNKLVKVFSL